MPALTPAPAALFGLPEWASRLVAAAIVVACALALLAAFRWVMPRLGRRLTRGAEPARLRERQTAIALLATTIRYAIVIVAVFGVAIALAGGGGLGAIGGGALLVVLVGFASQRLLVDVIAGFFILFENQYGVGDFVRLEPSGYSGVVEEVGLRTTVLRDLNGDRLFVPNGSISAVRRVPKGWRGFQVKLVTRDPDALAGVVSEVAALSPTGGARFLRPPRISDRRDLGNGLWALRVRAEVAPSLEWLVEGFLVGALKARAGDLLAADPVVLSLDPAVVERYQAGLVLP